MTKGKIISYPYRDKEGNLIRLVGEKEIKQIEEKTDKDVMLNESINLWRLRNK